MLLWCCLVYRSCTFFVNCRNRTRNIEVAHFYLFCINCNHNCRRPIWKEALIQYNFIFLKTVEKPDRLYPIFYCPIIFAGTLMCTTTSASWKRVDSSWQSSRSFSSWEPYLSLWHLGVWLGDSSCSLETVLILLSPSKFFLFFFSFFFFLSRKDITRRAKFYAIC